MSDNLEKSYYNTVFSLIEKTSPQVANAIKNEFKLQRSTLKLIASENYCSIAVQSAMGTLLTDKYAEGFPYHRFYAGCDNVDSIEQFASDKAKELFNADCAFVQPHSGSDANLLAYHAILNHRVEQPYLNKKGVKSSYDLKEEEWQELRSLLSNQRLLSLDYYSGGHLTHGYRYNVSGKMFDVKTYSVDKETYLLDYDEIERIALSFRPLIILAGYSAYPGKINFKKMREIADKSGAVLMSDMAHFAGLVAGKVFTNEYDPVQYSDIVTSTTHKTLRGPRGGIVLCKQQFKECVEKACPLMMGGPIPPVMSAKAIAFCEALTDDFKQYASQIVKNSKALAECFINNGIKVLTGGTENHLLLIDVSNFGITGRIAESALNEVNINVNRNALLNDINGPWYTSGLRIGTPAVTTLGMKEKEMKKIADLISIVIKNLKRVDNNGKISQIKYLLDDDVKNTVKNEVSSLLLDFKLYNGVDIN